MPVTVRSSRRSADRSVGNATDPPVGAESNDRRAVSLAALSHCGSAGPFAMVRRTSRRDCQRQSDERRRPRHPATRDQHCCEALCARPAGRRLYLQLHRPADTRDPAAGHPGRVRHQRLGARFPGRLRVRHVLRDARRADRAARRPLEPAQPDRARNRVLVSDDHRLRPRPRLLAAVRCPRRSGSRGGGAVAGS